MTTIKDLLRSADPMRDDVSLREGRERTRAATLAAGRVLPIPPRALHQWLAPLAAAAVVLVGVGVITSRIWFVPATLHAAAVRFEIRLAETTPTLDLQPARVSGTNRVIYLHREAIVTNDDIATARVTAGNAPDQFHVAVALTPPAGEKMRAATAGHIGRPVALLVDGTVISAPTVRSAIGAEALITGDFTKDEADRIANGMLLR